VNGPSAPEPNAQALDAYFRVMAQEFGDNPGNLRYLLETTFERIDLTGRSVLDIRAGKGTAGFYAAAAGAGRVVVVEPEGGSHSALEDRFRPLRELPSSRRVELRADSLRDFDPGDERFDVLVSMASINHVDEDACSRLGHDAEARERYLELLSKLAALTAPGGDLMVSDVSRHNLFAKLGITNPVAPAIEWHKHQPPELWVELLERVGFRDPHVRWKSFNSLRRPGRLLLGNRVAAYCSNSAFCLTMRRRAEA
jgi:SAM-dependent methyltransferase